MADVKFVFAGFGKAVDEIKKVPNAEYVGFKTGEELNELIANAVVTVCPSEMYENCPYSVMESQLLGTPVVGADIGGIPELIDEGVTGMLFESGNARELTEKIEYLYNNRELCRQMSENCKSISYDTISDYADKIVKIYEEKIK